LKEEAMTCSKTDYVMMMVMMVVVVVVVMVVVKELMR